jgi:hypothetical protein
VGFGSDMPAFLRQSVPISSAKPPVERAAAPKKPTRAPRKKAVAAEA